MLLVVTRGYISLNREIMHTVFKVKEIISLFHLSFLITSAVVRISQETVCCYWKSHVDGDKQVDICKRS